MGLWHIYIRISTIEKDSIMAGFNISSLILKQLLTAGAVNQYSLVYHMVRPTAIQYRGGKIFNFLGPQRNIGTSNQVKNWEHCCIISSGYG